MLALLALVAFARAPLAQGPTIPANDGWVTDLAHLLTAREEHDLEALMESYRAGSGQDVALLTVPDLGGRPIEELALYTAREWKLGDAKTSAGALLVVAKAEHDVRIEVGRGLEGTLNDARAGRIIRDVIVPEFRAQHFYAGIRAGIEAIHAALGGQYAPAERSPGGEVAGAIAPIVFFVIVMAILALFRRRLGGGRGSSSALPWILASQMGRSMGRGGSFGGFGGSSGHSSGGGFSGFGGGGGFSGGGASGKW